MSKVMTFIITLFVSLPSYAKEKKKEYVSNSSQHVCSIAIIQGSSASFAFDAIDKYETSHIRNGAIRLSVTCSSNFRIGFQANSPYFTSLNSSTPLPLEMLSLRVNGQSLAVPLSNIEQTLLVGTGPVSGTIYNIDYITGVVGYDYEPAIYGVTVIYTITPQ